MMDSSFDQHVELIRFAFPKYNISASYYEADKKFRKKELGYQSIHACKYDCALFWKDNDSMQNYEICNESILMDATTKVKKVSQKSVEVLLFDSQASMNVYLQIHS